MTTALDRTLVSECVREYKRLFTSHVQADGRYSLDHFMEELGDELLLVLLHDGIPQDTRQS